MIDEVEKKRRMVFITARVHPGESPASLVCQGKEEGHKSPYLLDTLIINNQQECGVLIMT